MDGEWTELGRRVDGARTESERKVDGMDGEWTEGGRRSRRVDGGWTEWTELKRSLNAGLRHLLGILRRDLFDIWHLAASCQRWELTE